MSVFWDDVHHASSDPQLCHAMARALSRVRSQSAIDGRRAIGGLAVNIAAAIAASAGQTEWPEAADRVATIIRTQLELMAADENCHPHPEQYGPTPS